MQPGERVMANVCINFHVRTEHFDSAIPEAVPDRFGDANMSVMHVHVRVWLYIFFHYDYGKSDEITMRNSFSHTHDKHDGKKGIGSKSKYSKLIMFRCSERRKTGFRHFRLKRAIGDKTSTL